MYEIKNYTHLKEIGKISDEAMQMHFKLYEGYVKNTNLILEKLKAIEPGSPEWNELHRRFGWEFDGMRNHELFFEGLTPNPSPNGEGNPEGEIKNKIIADFGSVESWKKDFLTIAKMRGIGWAMLVQDNRTGKLINHWVSEHEGGVLSDCKIILNVDMFEHAFIKDFGTDRAPYLESIFAHINWEVVSERLLDLDIEVE